MDNALISDKGQMTADEQLVTNRMATLSLDLKALASVSNIFRAATAVRTHMERTVLSSHALSWSAFVVLFVLRVWGEQESRDLAPEAGITAGTLSGVLDTLERKGFSERITHPEDRRKVVVALTASGLVVINEIMPAFNREEAQVTGRLTESEMAELARLLRIVLETAQDIDQR